MTDPRFRLLVYGPAAGYLDLVPDEDSIDCAFVRPSSTPGMDGVPDRPDLVLLDLDYAGAQADPVRARLAALDHPARVLEITRDPTAARDSAPGASASRFILPRDRDRVVREIQAARDAAGVTRGGMATLPGFPEIVARSEPMQRVLQVVRKVIDTGASPVLIRGETGTGKELVARAIHYQSDRRDQPFIEMNCTAIPETLLEAELFGYEAGAFTDARTAKPGLLRLADGGTLFLDELGDMSPNLQAKLLRAIETKRFRPLGGTQEVEVVMRLIAATSKNLEDAIQQGLFRSDLYYRLNVVSIELPALRDRGDDPVLLGEHFTARYAAQYGKAPRPLSESVRDFLREYPWPGNVRELKNVIERAVLLGDGGEIGLDDLAPASRVSRAAEDERNRLVIELPEAGFSFDEYEGRIVAHVLARNGWNRSRTARELGISRPRLLRKIQKHELEVPDPA